MAEDGRPVAPAVAVTMTVACTIPGLFTFFCPSVPDVKGHPVHEVRLGQSKGVACSLVLGAVGSLATKTPWPLLGAILIAALVVWQYEHEHRKSGETG